MTMNHLQDMQWETRGIYGLICDRILTPLLLIGGVGAFLTGCVLGYLAYPHGSPTGGGLVMNGFIAAFSGSVFWYASKPR